MSGAGIDLARKVTLRQLKIFEAIGRTGNVTRAAEDLFLTQPTASMQVKKLAEAVGMPLFEQIGRQVHLTEVGRELYETCVEVFGSLERLEMQVADMEGLRRGTLKVAVVTTAKYFAPHVLGHFKKQYPGIDISLKVSNRERVLERLAFNEDDLYIMGRKPSEGIEVEAVPIAPNPLVVMAPHGHPLENESDIPLDRLIDEPFIVREEGSGIRQATEQLFEEAGLQPNIIMELASNEAIKHAVASGLGLSVLSLHSLTLEGSNGPVGVLDVAGFPMDRTWYAVYPRGKKLSVVAESFLEFMVEEGQRVSEQMDQLLNNLNHPQARPVSDEPDAGRGGGEGR
ncbi:LysR family transcriptional regulator [Thiohalorhabdus methylotrophus]|uniref:LysR family transcriptional regulator n=1 Tax=Thiohalorhabdus methylotrophus TaxID=3242694 RepID=A0ABV4TW12_9GAMM